VTGAPAESTRGRGARTSRARSARRRAAPPAMAPCGSAAAALAFSPGQRLAAGTALATCGESEGAAVAAPALELGRRVDRRGCSDPRDLAARFGKHEPPPAAPRRSRRATRPASALVRASSRSIAMPCAAASSLRSAVKASLRGRSSRRGAGPDATCSQRKRPPASSSARQERAARVLELDRERVSFARNDQLARPPSTRSQNDRERSGGFARSSTRALAKCG
jgi:hypothetical protein